MHTQINDIQDVVSNELMPDEKLIGIPHPLFAHVETEEDLLLLD